MLSPRACGSRSATCAGATPAAAQRRAHFTGTARRLADVLIVLRRSSRAGSCPWADDRRTASSCPVALLGLPAISVIASEAVAIAIDTTVSASRRADAQVAQADHNSLTKRAERGEVDLRCMRAADRGRACITTVFLPSPRSAAAGRHWPPWPVLVERLSIGSARGR